MKFGGTVFACLMAAAFSLSPTVGVASPYLVSTPGIATQPLAPSSDTLELLANSTSTPLGVFILQSGIYGLDYTYLPDFTTPYVFNESITVDGNTYIVPISL